MPLELLEAVPCSQAQPCANMVRLAVPRAINKQAEAQVCLSRAQRRLTLDLRSLLHLAHLCSMLLINSPTCLRPKSIC